MPRATTARILDLDRLRTQSDPRELPAYTITEAAHHLRIPRATLGSWVMGKEYGTGRGPVLAEPVIELPDKSLRLLSFVNLVEAHVLASIKQHGVKLPAIRKALKFLQARFPSSHPLVAQGFQTDGLGLFVQKFGKLVNASEGGQLAMRHIIMEIYLRRIEWDESGRAVRLYPFVSKDLARQEKLIVIDPLVSFGRPAIAGTGVPTSVIAERFKAGDRIADLAEDYDIPAQKVEEAIRFQLPDIAA